MKLTNSEEKFYLIRKERNIKVFRLQVKAFETLKKAVEDFIPTIKNYDGKVINKRLITALTKNTQANGYSFDLTYFMYKPYIKIYVKDRSVNVNSNWLYIDFSEYEVELSNDNCNKLNAKETLKNFDSSLNYFQKQIEKYQDAADNYEVYFERFKVINDFIEANPVPNFLMESIHIKNQFI